MSFGDHGGRWESPAEEAAAAAASSAAPHPVLRSDILEISGRAADTLARDLAAWEANAAGSIAAGNDTWVGHAFSAPGVGPAALADPSWAEGDTASVRFLAPAPADAIAIRFRKFCAAAFGLVERNIHTRLQAAWDAVGARACGDIRPHLRWHAIMTLKRTAPEVDVPDSGCDIHADSFDGTIVCFALVSSKMGTPIFPNAQFAEPPLEQFVRESVGGPHCRPAAIRLAKSPTGRPLKHHQREWRDGSMAILPPAVAHSIPPGRVWDFESRGSDGSVLATRDSPRWFARVAIEIVPARGGAVDGPWWEQHKGWATPAHRAAVAALVAEHVWGDPEFAAAARAAFGNLPGFSP